MPYAAEKQSIADIARSMIRVRLTKVRFMRQVIVKKMLIVEKMLMLGLLEPSSF